MVFEISSREKKKQFDTVHRRGPRMAVMGKSGSFEDFHLTCMAHPGRLKGTLARDFGLPFYIMKRMLLVP
jgi:hypothetical protein